MFSYILYSVLDLVVVIKPNCYPGDQTENVKNIILYPYTI